MHLRIIAFALALATALPAFATPQHMPVVGLWIDPNESGWGLNLFHQATTVFGSLFVYGADGKARWYTASNMIDVVGGPTPDRPALISGDLFEATGPWFGGAFDSSKVARRKVGTMSIDFGPTVVVTYTIDSIRVQKQVEAFTWRADDISGDYIGYRWQPPAGEFNSGPEVKDEVTIHIADNGSSVTMSTIGTDVSPPVCSFRGTRSQTRNFVGVSGDYVCSAGVGTWFMAVDVTPDGILGGFRGEGISSAWGRIGAARRESRAPIDTGRLNDLWFPLDEPGWGVNILEQGDIVFATLFVYDPEGKPHWYSASELLRAGPNADDGRYEFVGPLYESTGPYFATPFNPSAVTRRVVGTMAFEPTVDARSADLTYTVDGVRVAKRVSRYAFQKNDLSGTYVGHISPPLVGGIGAPAQAVDITIDDSTATTVIDMKSSRGTCRYTAPVVQTGELRQLDGTFSCSDGRGGSFSMHDVLPAWHGFLGSFEDDSVRSGHIEGVRTQVN